MYSNGGKKLRNVNCNHGRKYKASKQAKTAKKKKEQDDGKTKEEESKHLAGSTHF
jgi:hypothetical protein